MFTDIVGYTAMMQRSEEQAVSTVKRHQEILENFVPQHEGEVLEYYGDGSLSIFNSASEAVRCAVEIQKRYRQAPKVPLRIGIHIGEVLFEDGKALGDCVNLASRIESIAVEGSVLISEKICREIENKAAFTLEDLGHFQFKNVFDPIRVYAVADEALYVPRREELSDHAERKDKICDLPSYPNSFIGRVHQINSITSLMLQDDKRLITLLGPGGMGKTRLSVKVGELLADDFEHGVCFVALDVVADHQQVPLYIGHRLGLKERFNSSWAEAVIDFLADKQLLLILDNLEQILEARTVIAHILGACPGVKILATSRENLGLPEELEYPLDSLNRPNPRLFPSPKDLLRFDAVDLFVQKAKSTLPRFQLTEDNALAVVQICQELEGLPLPIELAAARVKLFSPELILRKLKTNSDLLKTKSRMVVARHQTIRNTVQWSYDLLDPEEKQLFQQLALFGGGFTPEALEAVCPNYDSLDVIESFINKSLIVKGEEVYESPRFQMLKLIRDYGLEQLENNPEKDVYYERFSRYFIQFVGAGSAGLRSPEQAEWIALLEAEYENIRMALGWLVDHDPPGAGQLGAGFWRFHLIRAFLREGLEMIRQLLTLPIEDKVVKARLLEGAGTFSHNLGNYLESIDYFRQCLDLWKDLQRKREITKALNNVAWAEWRIGNYDRTISYSENALEIAEELDDQAGKARALNNLAWTYHYQGLFEKAVALQQEILDIHIRANNPRGIAFAKTNLGWAQLHTGKILEAEQMIDEGIQLFDDLKDQQLMAFSRLVKAEFLCAKKELIAAKELLHSHCLPDFEKIGDLYGLANSKRFLGEIHFMEKDFQEAKRHLTKSTELFRRSQDKFGQASTALWLSKLHWELDNFAAAEKSLDQCLSLAARMRANGLLMKGHLVRGRGFAQRELYEPAIRHFAVADHYAEKMGAHQHHQFLLEIKPHLKRIRDFLKSERIKPASISNPGEWEVEEDYLAGPINEKEFMERMEKLIRVSDAPPSNPMAGNTVPGSLKEDPFLQKARQVVETNLQDPGFSVQDLCREMAISHSQLHRRLTEETGLSPGKFIRSIRLAKAKELLGNPELTITAVAYDTGFKDPDYFYRVFKKELGMTPGEFRRDRYQK